MRTFTAQEVADILNRLTRKDFQHDWGMEVKRDGDYIDFDETAEAFGLEINYFSERGQLYTAIVPVTK
jgi:hypothetical protein